MLSNIWTDCLKLLQELFETYQNPALQNPENELKDEEMLNNPYDGMMTEEKMMW
mgnify:CR=1 FL=1